MPRTTGKLCTRYTRRGGLRALSTNDEVDSGHWIEWGLRSAKRTELPFRCQAITYAGRLTSTNSDVRGSSMRPFL